MTLKACAYSVWSNSTNITRSLCVVIVIVLVIASVGPGLKVCLNKFLFQTVVLVQEVTIFYTQNVT